jgi:hypothetical protein
MARKKERPPPFEAPLVPRGKQGKRKGPLHRRREKGKTAAAVGNAGLNRLRKKSVSRGLGCPSDSCPL